MGVREHAPRKILQNYTQIHAISVLFEITFQIIFARKLLTFVIPTKAHQ